MTSGGMDRFSVKIHKKKTNSTFKYVGLIAQIYGSPDAFATIKNALILFTIKSG